MKRTATAVAILATVLFTGCSAKSYTGKLDVVGVGAGQAPESSDSHYVDSSQFPNAAITYTPTITVKEQDVSKTTKFVAGDALVKEYGGEPKLLADWLNKSQKLTNAALLLDKNGVVAWHGNLSREHIDKSMGIYDTGLTGKKRMTFEEAMETYVLDGASAADYEEDKKIGFDDSGLFKGWSDGSPFLHAKLPDMTVVSAANGSSVNLSEYTGNGKPTLLVFFMASGKEDVSAVDVVEAGVGLANMLSGKGGGGSGAPSPAMVFTHFEDAYFIE